MLDLFRVGVGQVGVLPGTVKMVTSSTLDEISVPGFLNKFGNQYTAVELSPSDIIDCLYSFNEFTQSGTFTFLTVTINDGIITLAPNSGSDDLTSGHIFVGNASNVSTDVAMSGDISINNAGLTAINSGVIVNADINTSAAIAFSKLASLATGHMIVGNAGIPTDVAMSGDTTVSNTGVVTIASNAVTTGKIASNAVTTAKIVDANVTLAKLAPGINPQGIIKFSGKQALAGGFATYPLVVTGVLTSDIVFCQIESSVNPVTVQKVSPTADTITVLLSGDPGSVIFSYIAVRLAA